MFSTGEYVTNKADDRAVMVMVVLGDTFVDYDGYIHLTADYEKTNNEKVDANSAHKEDE